jgi:hypothetical protein
VGITLRSSFIRLSDTGEAVPKKGSGLLGDDYCAFASAALLGNRDVALPACEDLEAEVGKAYDEDGRQHLVGAPSALSSEARCRVSRSLSRNNCSRR